MSWHGTLIIGYFISRPGVVYDSCTESSLVRRRLRDHEITEWQLTIIRRFKTCIRSENCAPICIVILVAIMIFLVGSLAPALLKSLGSREQQHSCRKPRIRREWRSFTVNEKHDFVQAVLCLSSKPSRWGPNGTMYDDFALLHGEIGSWSTEFALAPQFVECVSDN